MDPQPILTAFANNGPIVVVLLIVLYAGHKGWWYWSPGVRALTGELRRERDDWRMLALTLLKKQGVELPEGFEKSRLPSPDPNLEVTKANAGMPPVP